MRARVALSRPRTGCTEAAQNILLKTLEEPPAGLVIMLAADEDDLLLPTVRSRAARIRLGPVPAREIEALLVETAGVDAAQAARIARLAGGRPGLAMAYARSADALTIRGEVSRSLLDLLGKGRASRLAGGSRSDGADGGPAGRARPARRGRGRDASGPGASRVAPHRGAVVEPRRRRR